MYGENIPMTGIATVGILGLTMENALMIILFMISVILILFRFTRLIIKERDEE